jgi:hypothetical protein
MQIPVRNAARSAPVDATPKRVAKLNATHRCDACSSRAYVAAEMYGIDLHFCKHHFERSEDLIRSIADELLDERWQLYDVEVLRKRTGVSA